MLGGISLWEITARFGMNRSVSFFTWRLMVGEAISTGSAPVLSNCSVWRLTAWRMRWARLGSMAR